jgi:hypothetical protein
MFTRNVCKYLTLFYAKKTGGSAFFRSFNKHIHPPLPPRRRPQVPLELPVPEESHRHEEPEPQWRRAATPEDGLAILEAGGRSSGREKVEDK